MNAFIDYLDIKQIQIEQFDLIVFYGCSGSGKSTQMKQLIRSQWQLPFSRINASPIPWDLLCHENKFYSLIQIDEISQRKELKHLRRLLSQKHKLVVASHVRPAWFWCLRKQYNTCIINLDQKVSKITLRLQQLGLNFSNTAVDHYLRCYGASFTEIDIILERCSDNNFDHALARFQKLNHIKLNAPVTRSLKLD